MNRVIIIHPKDKTTEFLKVIIAAVQQVKEVILLEPDSLYSAIKLQEELSRIYQENDIILFLGHGRSDGLYGALNDKNEKILLLNDEQARAVFNEKNTILFSCHSSSLLKKISLSVKKFVGFGNMPTDWDEIRAERDIVDHKFLSQLTNKSLERFKRILVEMIIAGSESLIGGVNFSRAMYLIVRMQLNKAMIDIASDKNVPFSERVELFKIIQVAKNEISYKD